MGVRDIRARWRAVFGFLIATWTAQTAAWAQDDAPVRRWLFMIQEPLHQSAAGDSEYETKVRAHLSSTKARDPLSIFALHDGDRYAFLLTLADPRAQASVEALSTLRAARLALQGVGGSETTIASGLLTEAPQLSYRPAQTPTSAAFHRYALHTFEARHTEEIDRLLQKQRALFARRGIASGYRVLRGDDTEKPMLAFIQSSFDRDTFDRERRIADQALGRVAAKLRSRLDRLLPLAHVVQGRVRPELSRHTGTIRASLTEPHVAIDLVRPQLPLPPRAPKPVVVAEPLPPPPSPVPIRQAETVVPTVSGVVDFVTTWADVWSRQQIDAYLSCYAASFQPSAGRNRSAWEAKRRERIGAPRSIRVDIEKLDILEFSPNHVVAVFEQHYQSDLFRDRVTKRLELVLEGEDWKIVRESAKP